MPQHDVLVATRKWVELFVIGLNLCPFAKREFVNNRIRFVASDASTEENLSVDLKNELQFLSENPDIETTLLVHPSVLIEFEDYNQFLNRVDELLIELDLEGVFQVASFHPDYQFAGTDSDDLENFTNRSPFPTLHLIREASLEEAIEHYPDVHQIPVRNIELMNQMGIEKLRDILNSVME